MRCFVATLRWALALVALLATFGAPTRAAFAGDSRDQCDAADFDGAELGNDLDDADPITSNAAVALATVAPAHDADLVFPRPRAELRAGLHAAPPDAPPPER